MEKRVNFAIEVGKKKKNNYKKCVSVPEGFKTRIAKELGEEKALSLVKAIEGTPSVSIRINAAKCRQDTRADLESRASGKVEWCEDGLRFIERPEFISDPLLHSGVYYVQEAASMYYQTILERLLPEFDKKNLIRILDLCAAPGGKTTAMLNALYKSGIPYEVVANEYDKKRVSILDENISKWGDRNVIVTNSEAAKFGLMEQMFDLIAVDAPCSGEGMMRREPIARTQWSENLVDRCASLQRQIVEDVLPALRPNGILIYSTCTFNRTENENNVEFFVEELGLELLSAPRRFMPDECSCEGLFVAVLRKSPENSLQNYSGCGDLETALQKNKVRIVSVGNSGGDDCPYVNLSKEDALNYLRGLSLTLPPDTPTGLLKVGYDGYSLGMMKNIGVRANNLYPKEWRIKKRG